jgi:hypothetical protein
LPPLFFLFLFLNLLQTLALKTSPTKPLSSTPQQQHHPPRQAFHILFTLPQTFQKTCTTMPGAGPSTSAPAAVTNTASGSDKARAMAAKLGGSIKGNASKGAAHAVKCGSTTCTGFRDFLIKGEEAGERAKRERSSLSYLSPFFGFFFLFARAKERKAQTPSLSLSFLLPHTHTPTSLKQARSSTSPSRSSSALPSPTSSRPSSRRS